MCIYPSKPQFWLNVKCEECLEQENCSIKMNFSLAQEHTVKAIEIAGRAAEARFFEKNVCECFIELYKECLFLQVCCEWEGEGIEEAVRGNEPLEVKDEQLEESEGMKFDCCEESSASAKRFSEIMRSKPEAITNEMMIEAFDLFPEAIVLLGEV